MPTLLDALCMSDLAYQLNLGAEFSIGNSDENIPLDDVFNVHAQALKVPPMSLDDKIGKVRHLTRRGWEFFAAEKNFGSGYQGVAFINHRAKKVVLSHRGTIIAIGNPESKLNIKCDIQILHANRAKLIPELYSLLISLFSFITAIKRKMSVEFPDYCMWQTGHSLGGFLAELGAAYLAHPNRIAGYKEVYKVLKPFTKSTLRSANGAPYLSTSRPQHANSMSFDSLGSINILNKLGIVPGEVNSHHYFLEPNIINTANPHSGTRYILLPYGNNYVDYTPAEHDASIDNQRQRNIQEFFDTYNSHALGEMLDRINHDTGNAHNQKMISSWPVGVNAFFTGDRPTQPAGPGYFDFFKHEGVKIAHSITDGVIAFAHHRSGGLAFDNRDYERPALQDQPNQCAIR